MIVVKNLALKVMASALARARKVSRFIGNTRKATCAIVFMVFASPAFADCYTAPVGSVGTVAPCQSMLIVNRTMLSAAVADGSYDFKPTDSYGIPSARSGDTNTYTFSDGANKIFTGQVTSFEDLFRLKTFNQDIGYWDTSNVTTMRRMFQSSTFNRNIGNWDTSRVTNMSQVFSDSPFNQNIGSWNTSSVTDMSSMFEWCRSFNQAIGNWNVSNVTNMSAMFYDAEVFNQDISSWNVAQVTTMQWMFRDATAFNGDITSWDVRNVASMNRMFDNAVSFNRDIRFWPLMSNGVIPYQDGMFLGAPLMLQNYGFTTTPTKPQFATPNIAPTLSSNTPARNATSVALSSNIVLTFSEYIVAGTGNVTISNGSSDVRVIPISDGQITISGETLTINPTAVLIFIQNCAV